MFQSSSFKQIDRYLKCDISTNFERHVDQQLVCNCMLDEKVTDFYCVSEQAMTTWEHQEVSYDTSEEIEHEKHPCTCTGIGGADVLYWLLTDTVEARGIAVVGTVVR